MADADSIVYAVNSVSFSGGFRVHSTKFVEFFFLSSCCVFGFFFCEFNSVSLQSVDSFVSFQSCSYVKNEILRGAFHCSSHVIPVLTE